MSLDTAKVLLIERMIGSIENGTLDEDVQTDLRACIKLAETVKAKFERNLLLTQLNDMVKERVQG